MIRITIIRDRESSRIVSFSLLGHAQYDEPGKDIVCAGVSAVAFGTVNAVEALIGVELPCVTDDKDGYFKVEVPHLTDVSQQEKLQLLLESLMVMLDGIEQSYGRFVKINTILEKGR